MCCGTVESFEAADPVILHASGGQVSGATERVCGMCRQWVGSALAVLVLQATRASVHGRTWACVSPWLPLLPAAVIVCGFHEPAYRG